MLRLTMADHQTMVTIPVKAILGVSLPPYKRPGYAADRLMVSAA